MLRMDAGDARPRSPAPASEGAILATDAANGATPPQPGTVPAPRWPLKLAASLVVGRDAGECKRVLVGED